VGDRVRGVRSTTFSQGLEQDAPRGNNQEKDAKGNRLSCEKRGSGRPQNLEGKKKERGEKEDWRRRSRREGRDASKPGVKGLGESFAKSRWNRMLLW